MSRVRSDALDLGRRELLVMIVLAALILAGGLFPNAILELTRVASQNWVSHLAVH